MFWSSASRIWNGSMRRVAELESRVHRLENQRPFRLHIFIRITINPGHDIFDRAEAGGEYFVRKVGESEQEFSARIRPATDNNPIIMYPQSFDDEFRAIRKSDFEQVQALPGHVSNSESGFAELDPTLIPRAMEKGD